MSWHALPAAFAREAEGYDDGFTAAVVRQYRGPIAITAVARGEG
ncbi:MAG: hypothetical protein U5S82_16070 [Gammaproteobacteria bacterium]|nr:hypothetical protein [Gammaproteobacteria bacterium]